jgi:hypothetical protein
MLQLCRQHLCSATAGGAVWLLARTAVGQELEIAYHAPESCPSAQTFRARVAQMLGGPVDALGRFGQFQVTLEAVPEAYRMTVRSTLRGEEARRTLTGPDCESVADAGALSIAMALSNATRHDEFGESLPEPAQSATEPEPAPTVAPPPASAARPEPRGPEPRGLAAQSIPEPGGRTSTAVALHSVGDYGTLPHFAPGVRLSFGVSRQRWSGRLGLEALPPVTQWNDGADGRVGGSFWLVAGRVEGCRRLAGSVETRIEGCAVLEAGALRASGVGVDNPGRGGSPWLATGGHLSGAVPLGNTQVDGLLGVEALVPLLISDFTVEAGRTKLYRPTSIVGHVDIGVAWRFE